MPNLKLSNIYVIFHKPYFHFNCDIFTPLYTNKNLIPPNSIALSSDTGDNIAQDNPLYAEFSTFYWAWKNQSTSEYIGMFHYRRFICFKDNVDNIINVSDAKNAIAQYGWDNDTLTTLLSQYDIILPSPIMFPFSVRTQYNAAHPIHFTKYLDYSIELIEKKYPDYIADTSLVLSGNVFYPANMFIMRTEFFNEYMNWIMDIFAELKIMFNPSYDMKLFAYLGERLFLIYLEHVKRVRNPRIKVNPWVMILPNSDNTVSFRLYINNAVSPNIILK